MENEFQEGRLPVTEEVLSVEKHVEDGRQVRVQTIVEDCEERLHEIVRKGVIDIDRVPMGVFVTEAPQVREEGDLLIVPLVEERLVVERRLFLVEEVRLRRSIVEVPVEIPETRRVMRAVIEDVSSDQQQQG